MIENKLEQLILIKSAEWGRRVTFKEISKTTGLAETTLSRMTTGNSQGIRYDVLDKLCTFFDATPNDILAYDRDGDHDTMNDEA